ncbi:MAG: ParB/RepB/Spo0J family partition protein [Planctomycetota bacterium]|jgi:ParB family chromosome partitioning protein|nr:ParB/RepB/Spo0J family partition protein [Planctomycetota bacterium]
MSDLLKAFVSDLREQHGAEPVSGGTSSVNPRLEWVSVEDIDPGNVQARTFSSPEETESLRESVARNGVLQPLILRPVVGGDKPYEVVAGHRRLDAATHAGSSPVPCVVRELDDDQAHLVMVAENVIREDLHPVDEAFAYRDLIRKGYVKSQGEIASLMGVSRTRVNRKIQLCSLHPEIIREVRRDRPESVREGHLEELLKIKPRAEQMALFRRTCEEKLTVGFLRRLVAQRRESEEGAPGKKSRKIYPFPEGEFEVTSRGIRFRPTKGFGKDLEPEHLIGPLEKLLVSLKRECGSYEKRFLTGIRLPV